MWRCCTVCVAQQGYQAQYLHHMPQDKMVNLGIEPCTLKIGYYHFAKYTNDAPYKAPEDTYAMIQRLGP